LRTGITWVQTDDPLGFSGCFLVSFGSKSGERASTVIDCPRCQTENRENARFCKECGQYLDANCPNCGFDLPSAARYCDQCGIRLGHLESLTGWFSRQGERPQAEPKERLRRRAATESPREEAKPQGANSAELGPPQKAAEAGDLAASSALHRFLPQELAAKLEEARQGREMIGERRVVTMLFCDVKGSTAAAEHLDPEDWTEIINGAFEQMIRPIYKYEGTVARLMGDAILAFFGAPIAHEDDPVRAVLAGLDIIEGFGEYRGEIEARYGLQIEARVGINTGRVVVGAVGSDLRMEYTAMGDAINLAARMEQTAEPGTVQIAGETYKLVAPLFEVEELGGISVKGRSEPVDSYRVLRRQMQPGRLRGIAGLETRLIGRDWELEQLTAAADTLARGIGRSICLIGEAGLGKSRLTQELKRHWQEGAGANGAARETLSGTWHEAASFSFETLQPYALFQRLFRRLAGIDAHEDEASAISKLEQLVAQLPAQENKLLSAVLTSLTGLSSDLEGEAFRKALFDGLPTFFRWHFGRRPGVLILDDLHWSDSASVELLLHLLPLVEELPLLWLCVFRPDEDAPGWRVKVASEKLGGQSNGVLLLRPLSERDSNALIDELLGGSELPGSLRAQILEKSSGNPFFVEEVVRTLLDGGWLMQGKGGQGRIAAADGSFDIPDNLQALLTARIDRLNDAVRQTLQLAAVIGRTFYHRVLQDVAQSERASSNGDQPVIESHLSSLQRQQMILEAARKPERLYKFRNALTQEAAYKAILRRRRRTLHGRTGRALEAFFADSLEEHAATLAYHFSEAGDDGVTLRYLMMAGDRSFRLFALQEAAAHYERAMEIVRRRAGVDGALCIELCTQRGRALELLGRHKEAVEHYQELRALAEEAGDRRLVLASLAAQATLYSIPSQVMDAKKGEQFAKEAQIIAGEIGDWEAAAKLLWSLMLGAMWELDQPGRAIEYGEASLKLARDHGLARQLAHSSLDLATAYLSVGRSHEARPLLVDAQARFERLENRPLLSQAYRTLGVHHYMQGELAAARVEMEKGLAIERQIENRWGLLAAEQAMATTDFELGRAGKAITRLEWSLDEAMALDLRPMRLYTASYLARAYALVGDTQAALEILEEMHRTPAVESIYPAWSWSIQTLVLLQEGDVAAAREANEVSQIDFDPDRQLMGAVGYVPVTIRLANTGVALASGDLAFALNGVEELLDYLDRVELRLYRPEALQLNAQILAQMGRAVEARDIYLQARRESEAMGERRMRWLILAGMAEVARDAEEAAHARREAWEVIRTIAEHAGREAHRRSFLERADVRPLRPAGDESG
jgi:class 3 adenylate cyclase/tetratricopeptide (TPR) repeat protein